MMFSCCDPRVAEDAQIPVILHVLCGFSVAEIASAFVVSDAAIEKRITRAKKVLATSKRLFDVAAAEQVAERIPAVHRALYLLFNEGFHGASDVTAVRADLCREAMRLVAALIEHPFGRTPSTYALAALMALHAARLPARLDARGDLLSLSEQDRDKWDRSLIGEGLAFLDMSARGTVVSEYHLEAAIAALHVSAQRVDETDWPSIVRHYDALSRMQSSPIVALNRAIAIAQCEGPCRGLDEIAKIPGPDRLAKYPFYPAAIGELERRLGRRGAAREHFRAALSLARNSMEQRYFARRERESSGEDTPLGSHDKL
jgi:RNA polymerase sigma-70 factor (ECF subfamily)